MAELFDLEALKIYLTIRYVPSSRSIFAGETIPASGRVLSVEEVMRAKNKPSISPRILRAVCEKAVRASASPSKRFCVVTGGGIDSSSIVALLHSFGFMFEAVAMGFNEPSDEDDAAQQLCDHFGVRLHRVYCDNVLGSTADAMALLGVPYRGAGYTYDLAVILRSLGFDMMVDGLGVDEFFGGYGFRYEKVLALHREGLSRCEAYLRGANPLDYVEEGSAFFGDRLKDIRIQWPKLFPYFENNLSFLEQIWLADYNGKCIHNFMPLAKIHRALGVEPAYPWLSDEFVNFALRVPPRLKYDPVSRVSKILFRQAFGDILPTSTLLKKKQGFGPPLDSLWRKQLCTAAEDTVQDGYMVSNGYLNRDFFKNVLAKDEPSSVEIVKCWEVYTLEKLLEVKRIA